MNRLSTVLASAAAASALVGLAPPASAAPVCTDPAHPIVLSDGFDVIVGTKKVKTVDLLLGTGKGCAVDSAVAVVTGPSQTYRVKLHRGADHPDVGPDWTGSFKIDPKKLHNSDAGAGAWKVRYEVSGPTAESVENVGRLRRATRASFNAGPEPVRHNKITFSGTLKRADWDKHRYVGISRTVTVQKFDQDGVEYADVVELDTRADGHYRTSTTFPGANTYWLNYDGDNVSGHTTSRRDRVDAP